MRLIANGSIKAVHTDSDFGLNEGEGTRTHAVFVEIEPSFTDAPKISAALNAFDIIDGENPRLKVEVRNIQADHFEIVFTTWGATKVASVEATWIAWHPLFDNISSLKTALSA